MAMKKLRNFLQSEHLFLVVHGAGGVGKTRFVVEAGALIAGEGQWQVLWANVETMTASAIWFDGVVPERPTLLLVGGCPETEVRRWPLEVPSGFCSEFAGNSKSRGAVSWSRLPEERPTWLASRQIWLKCELAQSVDRPWARETKLQIPGGKLNTARALLQPRRRFARPHSALIASQS